MLKILAFDTETTDKLPISDVIGLTYNEKKAIEKGLVDKNIEISTKFWDYWCPKFPYITQLSYIIYDTENETDIKIFNKYIDIVDNDNAIINLYSSNITHIYKNDDDAINKGQDPNDDNLHILSRLRITEKKELITDIGTALHEFMDDFIACDYIVAHNIDFDKKMLLVELKRLGRMNEFNLVLQKQNCVCTLMETINICKLESINKLGNIYFKFPKLIESYEVLFGYVPSNDKLHNSLIDVVICLRIFCKLGKPINTDIYGKNTEITKLIDSFTPFYISNA